MDKKMKRGWYLKFTKRWGRRAQLTVAVEEMAELTHAICKLLRKGRENSEVLYHDHTVDQRVVSEVADVSLMIDQITAMYGIEERVKDIKAYKLARTISRYENDREKNHATKRLPKTRG